MGLLNLAPKGKATDPIRKKALNAAGSNHLFYIVYLVNHDIISLKVIQYIRRRSG